MNPRALIAEDEPLLAIALHNALAQAWPELQVASVVGDGASAVQHTLALQPDVLFLDIRMPGLTGLEAAHELIDAWNAQTPFPALVFVTAYDQYAVQAFEAQAVDYLLKPVAPERLARTVQRLQHLLAQRQAQPLPQPQNLDDTVNQLRALLASAAAPLSAKPLQVIQASVGNSIRLLPVGEVLVFEAADKYVRVLTADSELLVRTPLKELLPRLDPAQFWQIHRGTVVQASAIHSVQRDEVGRLSLKLKGQTNVWPVSRLYAGLFRAM